MRSVKLKISPKILKWARTSLHLTEDDVVNHFSQKSKIKFAVDINFLNSLENDQQEINFVLLEELANLYKRPLAVFFLTEPPVESPSPKDRRTIGSGVHKILSPEAILVLRRARYVQEILSELSEELGWSLNSSFRKIYLSEDAKKNAEDFRKYLNFSIENQVKIKDSRELFNAIRQILEEKNIFALKASFPTTDARAFSLTDKSPNVIVINNKDGGYFGYAPKSFSLLHEFSHILLGEGAICNDFSYSHQAIEAYCNEFSASFLVPDNEFIKISPTKNNFNKIKIEEYLESLQVAFKVSKEVLLRKYLLLGFIDEQFYEQKTKEWREEYEKTKTDDKGFVPAISPSRRAINNNSKKFVDIVLHAKSLGKITLDKAAEYLNISIKSLPEIENLSTKS